LAVNAPKVPKMFFWDSQMSKGMRGLPSNPQMNIGLQVSSN
jgi:hypothetical protein